MVFSSVRVMDASITLALTDKAFDDVAVFVVEAAAALQLPTVAAGRDDFVAGVCGICSLQYSYAHISI